MSRTPRCDPTCSFALLSQGSRPIVLTPRRMPHSKKKKKSKSSSAQKARDEREGSAGASSSKLSVAHPYKTDAERRFEEVQRKRVRFTLVRLGLGRRDSQADVPSGFTLGSSSKRRPSRRANLTRTASPSSTKSWRI